MPRIAISGHRGLNAHTTNLIDQAIRESLSKHPGSVTGMSCLADGADQIFARAVIDLGERSKSSFQPKNTGQVCPPRCTPNMTTC